MIFWQMILTKSLELLIFKCALQQREIIALEKYLPADEFCIVSIPGERMSFGIMNDELHSRFMDILSGETLECLEYLDESDFEKLRDTGGGEVIGNSRLLDKLSF
jgi:hypothetical protein